MKIIYLKKKKNKGIEYYVLFHRYGESGKYKYMEYYVGVNLPENIDEKKEKFFQKILQKRWFDKLNRIQENYINTVGKISESAIQYAMNTFSINFTYNSNRIEGNTLSFKQTKLLLQQGISPSNKPEQDIIEIKNHHNVFQQMVDYKGELSDEIILQWHYDLFKDTKPDIAGTYRVYDVAIEGSEIVPPKGVEVNELINEFYIWFEKSKDTMHPVELATLVHQHFVSIHPFGDGNGRISRLLMNYILNKFNYPMISINFLKRKAYFNAIHRSLQSDDPYIFVFYIFRLYLKTYQNYLD